MNLKIVREHSTVTGMISADRYQLEDQRTSYCEDAVNELELSVGVRSRQNVNVPCSPEHERDGSLTFHFSYGVNPATSSTS